MMSIKADWLLLRRGFTTFMDDNVDKAMNCLSDIKTACTIWIFVQTGDGASYCWIFIASYAASTVVTSVWTRELNTNTGHPFHQDIYLVLGSLIALS